MFRRRRSSLKGGQTQCVQTILTEKEFVQEFQAGTLADACRAVDEVPPWNPEKNTYECEYKTYCTGRGMPVPEEREEDKGFHTLTNYLDSVYNKEGGRGARKKTKRRSHRHRSKISRRRRSKMSRRK